MRADGNEPVGWRAGDAYRSPDHFRLVLGAVATHHRQANRWLGALTASAVLALLFAPMALLAAYPPAISGFVVTAGVAALVTASVLGRRAERRRIDRIVEQRLCFRCAQSLTGVHVDDGGWGICPECGRRFNGSDYRCPPGN